MKHCGSCGFLLKPGKNFCGKCGTAVASRTGTQIWCASCHSTIPLQKRFCGKCGARVIRIGRKSDNDVVLDYPMISDHHAVIAIQRGTITIEDLRSANGTAIGTPQNKISQSTISPQDTVYLGSFPILAEKLISGELALGKSAYTVLNVSAASMILGRAPDCDVVLDHPMVAHRHAKISRSGDSLVVADLGTKTGTFVNGNRIQGSVKIKVGDLIRVGSYSFHITAPDSIKQRNYTGNVTLEARDIDLHVKGKSIVEDVSLTIYPSEIVALMGPSGAGKTTLLNALNGYMRPVTGNVLLNGQDLYNNYQQFCGHIGYVPQDDIMHRDLTVGQALYYTARLRLPADFADTDIQTRIGQILKLLELEGTENVIVGSPEKRGISGGQRKRVNLAMELLTEPSILFLDEPTSGLSSEDALTVMKLLRSLANAGKTVLISIHQPGLSVFRLADTLLLVSKDKNSVAPAKMVYFGPAYPDAVHFFNPAQFPVKPGVDPSPDEIMQGLGTRKTEEWVNYYGASKYKDQYLDARLGKRPSSSANPVSPKIHREPGLSQWRTLVRRSVAIKLKNKWSTAILLLQAPFIASLLVLVFGKGARELDQYPVLGQTFTSIFLLIITAIWLGCSNAAREIVSEWAVYYRERMVNLKIPSYVASKFTVLGSLCVFQSFIMLTIVYVGCELQGPFIRMLLVLIVVSLVALAMSLVTSALASTSDVATALVPVLLLPMVFLGGFIQSLDQMVDLARPIAALIPARWAFEAFVLLEDESRGGSAGAVSTYPDGKPIYGTAEHFFSSDDRIGVAGSVAILLTMLVVLTVAVMKILRSRDVHK